MKRLLALAATLMLAFTLTIAQAEQRYTETRDVMATYVQAEDRVEQGEVYGLAFRWQFDSEAEIHYTADRYIWDADELMYVLQEASHFDDEATVDPTFSVTVTNSGNKDYICTLLFAEPNEKLDVAFEASNNGAFLPSAAPAFSPELVGQRQPLRSATVNGRLDIRGVLDETVLEEPEIVVGTLMIQVRLATGEE